MLQLLHSRQPMQIGYDEWWCGKGDLVSHRVSSSLPIGTISVWELGSKSSMINEEPRETTGAVVKNPSAAARFCC